jgi:YtkA-like
MRQTIAIGVALAAGLAVGCQSGSQTTADADVVLQIQPDPPHVGPADVVLTLNDAAGAPLSGAEIQLEGDMNHAGMQPVFADLEETEPGRYAGSLNFTMGGDWFILVTGTLADGRRVEDKIDVPGVKSQ